MQDPIEPVDEVPYVEPVQPTARHKRVEGPPGHGVIGEVIEIRAQSHRHAEEHTFDATVGEHHDTEIVVKIISGPYNELKDRRVSIQVIER